MADIFREVDEDLRRDDMGRLWKKYGGLIIAAAAVVVLLVAAVVGYREWQARERLADANTFQAARDFLETDRYDAAKSAFASLGEEGADGYALLSRFAGARVAAESGNRDDAAAAYRAISEDGEVEQLYRNLAVILWGLNGLETGGTALRDRLQPLADDPNGPWRVTARELLALYHVKEGELADARELLTLNSTEDTVPQSARRRADTLLTVLSE